MTMLKTLRGLFVAIPLLLLATSVSAEEPAGTVTMESESVAIGIGVEWGDGTLTLEDGNKYNFSVEGLSVVDLGVSKVSTTGEVYKLADVSKFAGTYTAAKAGIAVGGGGEWTVLENQNGVVMKLKATQVGIKLSLAGEGLKVDLK